MVKRVDPDELPPEQEHEMKAAFGEEAVENGEIVQLERSDPKEVPDTEYPMEELLEVGDHMEYQTRSGKVISGTVTEVGPAGFYFDRDEEKCGVGSGYEGYDSFGGERGLMLELLTVNGEEVDVQYEAEVVEG